MDKNELPKRQRLQIDLDGPDGNAFVILGYTKSLCKSVGYNEQQAKKISAEMKESDYDHLLLVFLKYFDAYVDIWTSNADLLKTLNDHVKHKMFADDILEHED